MEGNKRKKAVKKEAKKVDKRVFFVVCAEMKDGLTPKVFGGFCTSSHAKTVKEHLEKNIDEVVYAEIVPIITGDKK